MSKITKFEDHMMILADYKAPVKHKHLLSHIMISLDGECTWKIEGETIVCQGICIGSDVQHETIQFKGRMLAFLFTPVGNYGRYIEQHVLEGKPYYVFSKDVVEEVLSEYDNQESAAIVTVFPLHKDEVLSYDERVEQVIRFIDRVETIDKKIMDRLSQSVFLSKSRLSHLFKEETNMTLHSYLAFQKIMKTYEYYREGRSLTESCLLAGFNSSSHCSATCKRMFGMAFTDIN